MAWFGFALLLMVGGGIITTGLPAAVVSVSYTHLTLPTILRV